MEKKNKKNGTNGQAEKKGRWPEIQPGILALIKRLEVIVSIKNRDGWITFYLYKEPDQSFEANFKDLCKRLCKNIFLPLNCTTLVNINHITDCRFTKAKWEIMLTDGLWYTITEGNKERFREKKYQILRILQLRKEEQAKRHKKLFSSKYAY
jgi:hypothetical protein